MKRRSWMKMSLAAAGAELPIACCRRLSEVAPFATLAELSHARHAGRISAGEVLAQCLDRIAVFDKTGPGVNSLVELNPAARDLAARLDAAPRAERFRAPLHGLPIALKDNIDTADAMETTAGSLALLGAPKPAHDATVARKLREAGMVIVGKTNLSEWANFRSPNSTSGWSARGGLTVNPHRTTHSASGSSSGSAAAVAAGFVPAAIGTETNGSIVSPASACGIVGLKPTVGLVSRTGIVPITHWQDTAGPLTLTCWDAALVLGAIAGVDEADAQTAAAREHVRADYTRGIAREALKGARLGILRPECGTNEAVLAVFKQACEALRDGGAELVEVTVLPNQKEMKQYSWAAMFTEFREDLNAYLQGRGGAVASLAQLIAFNRAQAGREMPYFAQEFFEEAERRHSPQAVEEARDLRTVARRLAGAEGLDAVLKEHRLDALICPTNDPAARIDLEHGDPDVRCASSPAAIAGSPHLTVPMGFAEGMPVGLSFMGPAWSEGRLLAYGHAFEALVPARRAPDLVAGMTA